MKKTKAKNIEDIYELSPMQQGMLFHTLYMPESGVYVTQLMLRLNGKLNRSAFKQAWQEVVARHPVLRTFFVWEGRQKPLQIVRRRVTLPWIEHDWRGVAEQETQLETLLMNDREQGFSLQKAPLMRFYLIQLAQDTSQFVWSCHHLLMDGWSLPLVVKEVWAFYEAADQGRSLYLPSPRPYGDYIVWLAQQDYEAAERYWRQALQGFTAPTLRQAQGIAPLVVDHRASVHDLAAYSEHQVYLPSNTTAALQKMAALNRLTTNTVIQGAWALLLSRYSGEEEVLFGATVSGRPAELSGVKTMVGLFINTSPVRVSVPTDMPLVAWLSDLQQQQREREQYAYTPLIDIQGWSEISRGMPLFESLLVYENYPLSGENWQEKIGLQITNTRSVEQTNYPLTVVATLTESYEGTQLHFAFSYDTRRFEHDTISRMVGHLQTLLSGIVANPDQPIANLPLLTKAEKHQLLVEWNDTQADYPSDKCIHQLFEQQVARTPDAVAVVFENQHLTYHELNTRANQLAHYLIAQGVGPDVLVGICIPRSVEMVVGLLGILKAGGAYVPLDPSYPNQRLEFVLEDAKVPLLLTNSKLVPTLPRVAASRSSVRMLLDLDQEWPLINKESTFNPMTKVCSDDLAYCIYTSGSTGRPKGTLIVHKGLTNYLSWCLKSYPVASGSGSPVNSSIGFDATITSIFTPLLVGKKVILLPEEEEIEALGEVLASDEQLSLVKITPAHLGAINQLLLTNNQNSYQCQAFIVGGEALLKNHVAFLQTHQPEILLVNEYGPTETVVGCCVYEVPPSDALPDAIPIGRPIANTQLYILDRHLQPVPIGVLGELHIGGAGVARGYLNRPQLTIEKFISNPFGACGSRLYKTGDLCRYLPDGNIEFVGRTDYQVKIRGFRIELGEIEATFNSQPNVREAVVVVRESPNILGAASGKRLVAYVVQELQGDERIPEGELARVLRDAVRQKLPHYMIPSAFVELEAMPLTPNGKIDRRALPAPREAYRVDSAKVVLPRTPVERILATIWQEVLGLKQVGVTDNFFEVGGDSIISIQIVSRAKEAGINITPRDLFQHQTIGELASVAKQVQKTDAEQGIVTGRLPLTPIQHWFLEQSWRERHHFNQSVFLELTSEVNPTWLSQAVEALLAHHDALRLRFFSEGDNWRQVIVAPQPLVPFEVIDLTAYSVDEQEALANELQASLNLSQGPLLRVALFSSRTVNRLLIVIHHLAVDGVSWRILLEDLQRVYQQIASGEPIQLPAKSTSFKQWATLLNEKGPSVLEAERDYWAQVRVTKALPVDYRLGPNDNASAATISTRLDRAHTEALLNEVPAVYHTQINDLLLTALLLAYVEWTGERALLLNLEGHGREELFEVDLSRTVGWFTTIFPVRLDMSRGTRGLTARRLREGIASDLGETIKHVKEQLRQIPNRGIGYGILYYLSSEKLKEIDAQISFNYLGQLDLSAKGTLIKGFASPSSGSPQSVLGQRFHLLDINGMVIKGQLQVDWTYSRNFHRADTIQKLANRFIDALAALIAHCQEPEAGAYTPSDFPEVELNQEELDDLLNGQKSGIEAIYPLSGMQQGMLFHSLYAPQSGVYFEQMAITLVGKLDTQAFKEAWQQVVAQHPVLRTYFVWPNSPLQVVLQKVELPWTEEDWRLVEDKEEQLESYLADQRKQGFELDRAPLMRFALMQIRDESYYFLWNHHHLLLDGWSTPLVLQEVWAAYHRLTELREDACRGERLSITRPRPYKDYIVWLQQQDMVQAEAYWRQALQGFTAPTPLVVDHRVRVNDHDQGTYSEHQLYFSSKVTAALQNMTALNRLTINTVIQGTWALLLSRYSSDSDVLFGATVSGRPAGLSGVEKMVGLFINTLPVRVLVNADLSLLAWLSDLQEQQREREQYAYAPLIDIQGWSDVPRGTPLFESLLVYENYPVNKVSVQEKTLVQITDIRSEEQTNYPLTLVAALSEKEDGAQLYLLINYDTSRFEQDTISRMTGHFQTLLEGIVANPNQPIANLPLLTEREKQQLLIDWNDTQADYPSDKCLHQLFEYQAQRTPEAIAVMAGSQALTYRELNARANQLAHYLIKQGVGPDVLVAICLPRSVEMVVGLLGILKAGGAYVPLDPSYPSQRLEFMLEDAKVPLLLTNSKLAPTLPRVAPLLDLDQEWPLINKKSTFNPMTKVCSDDLAYCIYTSGSTGQPKGTLIVHRGLTNYLSWSVKSYPVASGSGSPVNSSIGFDATITSIFTPLLVGKKVILLPEEKEIEALGEVLASGEQLSLVKITPAHLEILNQLWPTNNQQAYQCQAFIVGGEALLKNHVAFLQTHQPEILLVNEYGPTETVVGCCVYEVPPNDPLPDAIPIGRPIANTQLYILDRHLQPVPIGVPGELHIGGAGVARGYLNRPQLTAKKFIANPFGAGRLYKTGDLCRYLSDGNIEYLGRTDYQVKIRGFRIELGEIEAVLSQHEAVREVVVIVQEQATGKRLVAYLVCKHSVENSTLQAYLSSKLPDYMIPSVFVQLDAWPLTPNGKVNRRALPAPTRQSQLETAYVEPSTDTERQIVAVWQEVLQVEKVGIHDNFFELGGHSLLTIRLHQRLQGMYEQPLTITDLFKYPTVHTLARYVSQPTGESSLWQNIEKDQTAESRTLSRRTRRTTAKERRQLRQKHRSRRKEKI